MNNINNTNKYITTYKQINDKLKETAEIYLDTEDDSPKEFIERQKKANNLGFENRLIKAPEGDIYKIIKEQYQIENCKDEPLGTLSPEEQAEGIKKTALLMLMANRASKSYRHLANTDNSLDEEKTNFYKKKEREFLVTKDQATSDLLSSLFVLKKSSNEKYSNYFYYGLHKDEKGKDALIVDLPEYGQISVHFGNMKEVILKDAKEKTASILETKKEKGQLSQEELEANIKQISEDSILPTYEENLYEMSSALPLKYVDEDMSKLTKKLYIFKKDPGTINNSDMNRMIKSGLNVREARYLCLKLGCPKTQLQELVKNYSERNIIKNSFKETNAEERNNIRQQQQKNLQKFKEDKKNKSIGGR